MHAPWSVGLVDFHSRYERSRLTKPYGVYNYHVSGIQHPLLWHLIHAERYLALTTPSSPNTSLSSSLSSTTQHNKLCHPSNAKPATARLQLRRSQLAAHRAVSSIARYVSCTSWASEWMRVTRITLTCKRLRVFTQEPRMKFPCVHGCSVVACRARSSSRT